MDQPDNSEDDAWLAWLSSANDVPATLSYSYDNQNHDHQSKSANNIDTVPLSSFKQPTYVNDYNLLNSGVDLHTSSYNHHNRGHHHRTFQDMTHDSSLSSSSYHLLNTTVRSSSSYYHEPSSWDTYVTSSASYRHDDLSEVPLNNTHDDDHNRSDNHLRHSKYEPIKSLWSTFDGEVNDQDGVHIDVDQHVTADNTHHHDDSYDHDHSNVSSSGVDAVRIFIPLGMDSSNYHQINQRQSTSSSSSSSWYRQPITVTSTNIDVDVDVVDEVQLDDESCALTPSSSSSSSAVRVHASRKLHHPRSSPSSSSYAHHIQDLSDNLKETMMYWLRHSSSYAGGVAYHTMLGIKENPWVANATGCAAESVMFAAERARYITAVAHHHIITADDPEIQYLNYISDGLHGGEWGDVLRLTSHHATLRLGNRQLVDNIHVASTSSSPSSSSSSSSASCVRSESDVIRNDDGLRNVHHDVDAQRIYDLALLADRKQLVSTQHDNINDDDVNDDDSLDSAEEAGYILTRMFVPPVFKESSCCHTCARAFNMVRFRHHCRNCGESYCNDHSNHRRRILHYGITLPVRICDDCARAIDRTVDHDMMIWKRARVRDYLAGSLKPYRPPRIDRHVDKIYRVTDYAIHFVKKSLILSYPALIALETLDILKRYGISGLAGVMLREDFIEAVETLKSISGMDKAYPISLHELTACIYYKLAINRGIRGCMPEEEHVCHSPSPSSPTSSSSSTTDSNAESAMPSEVLESDMTDALRFAPLALKAVYFDSIIECQRIGWLQGWELICSEFTAAPEQPAYALFATDIATKLATAAHKKSNSNNMMHHDDKNMYHGRGSSSSSPPTSPYHDMKKNSMMLSGRKEAVLVIRGTHSVHDLVTDIRATPMEFPPQPDEVAVINTAAVDMKASSSTKDAWIILSAGKNYACGGMVRAALWLYDTIGPSLLELHKNNCDIIITGHSLGGGVASLLTYLLQKSIPSIRCITYGCPPCLTAELADELRHRVLSVALHDDVICRLTPISIRQLLKDLMAFRGKVFCNGSVFQHLQSDWNDIIERTGSLWSPRWREVHPRGVGMHTNLIESDDNYLEVVREKGYDDMNMSMIHHPSSRIQTATININPLDEHCDLDPSLIQIAEASWNEEIEIVDEDKMLDIWLPGRIMHIYAHRGQYKAMMVSRTFPTLRRIEVQGNIFTDHTCDAMINALREVVAVRSAPASPPPYQSFAASDVCHCCKNKFTWHSTFRGKPQEYREKHNCRHCGYLVCGPCARNEYPIAKYGLIFPGIVCDACVVRGDFAVS